MQIGSYGLGTLSAQRASDLFGSVKDTLGTLQGQLSTGRVGSTYSAYGGNASTALYLNSRLSRLDTYDTAIGNAQTKVNLAATGLQHVSSLASSLGTQLVNAQQPTAISQTATVIAAKGNLAETIDALNQNVNGVYLFSGRASDTKPVLSVDTILNGDATHAGLTQLVAERKAADLGTGGLGRVTVGGTGNSVSLTEQASGPFGFKVAPASATGSALSVSSTAGPTGAAVAVTSQPDVGDAVTFNLTLPDGSTTAITLTARADTGSAQPAGAFAIGATASDTATNLRAALTSAVGTAATTTLASASALKASNDFFAASVSSPPPRVPGPPYETATALTAGTADNTVIWYQGDDATGSARETVPVTTGDTSSVAIGLRANEPGLQKVLAVFGAIAADTYPASDTTSSDRLAALASRGSSQLLGDSGVKAVNTIVTDLSDAKIALGNASDRVAATTNQINDALDPIENVSTIDVTQKLVETQTRLQASYQITAAIGKLSLTDFLT